jgi:hypothetical protein
MGAGPASGGVHAATRRATSSIDDPVNVREMLPIEVVLREPVARRPVDGSSIGVLSTFVKPVYTLDIGHASRTIHS